MSDREGVRVWAVVGFGDRIETTCATEGAALAAVGELYPRARVVELCEVSLGAADAPKVDEQARWEWDARASLVGDEWVKRTVEWACKWGNKLLAAPAAPGAATPPEEIAMAEMGAMPNGVFARTMEEAKARLAAGAPGAADHGA